MVREICGMTRLLAPRVQGSDCRDDGVRKGEALRGELVMSERVVVDRPGRKCRMRDLGVLEVGWDGSTDFQTGPSTLRSKLTGSRAPRLGLVINGVTWQR